MELQIEFRQTKQVIEIQPFILQQVYWQPHKIAALNQLTIRRAAGQVRNEKAAGLTRAASMFSI